MSTSDRPRINLWSHDILLWAGGFICLLSAGVLAVWSISSAPDVGVPPVLDVEPSEWNFGSRKQNEEVDARFTIRNLSNERIRLVSVDPGCACTSVDFIPTELSSGATHVVTLRLRLGRSRGKLTKTAALNYTVGEQKLLKRCSLSITGEVVPEYDVEPRELSFDPEQSDAATVVVTSRPGRVVNVLSAHVTHRAFRLRELATDQGTWRGQLHFDAAQWSWREGERANLVINTDSNEEPTFFVRLRVLNPTGQGRVP